MDDDEKIKKELADPRLGFFEKYVTKFSNTSSEKWAKMVSTNEHRGKIFQFISKPNFSSIMFCYNGTLMVPSLNGFSKEVGLGKGNVVYFLRRSNVGELTIENLNDSLSFGSCSNNPIEDLSTLTDGLYVPVLTNPLNQDNWPKVLVKDVNNVLQELKNNIAETTGNMTNRTILPLPITLSDIVKSAPAIMKGDLSSCGLNMRESLDQVILKWSRSIETVISEDSINIWKTIPNAKPCDEIKFWNDRLKNMENIFEQLVNPDVKTMISVAERIGSIYVNLFTKSLTSVTSAIHEARDITRYLRPLIAQLDKIDASDFTKVNQFVLPLIHTMMLIWSKSNYYCTNKRMIQLFKMIHNHFIEQVIICLDPDSIFQNDVDDSLKKTTSIIENLLYYKQIQREYQGKLKEFVPNDSNLPLWTFKPDTISTKLDAFIERLRQIKEIFETSLEFKKLEDIIFGGDRGKWTTEAVRKTIGNFKLLYVQLEQINFNCLDLQQNAKFTKLYQHFTLESECMERSLGKQFNFVFDDCKTCNALVKQIISFDTIIERPIIRELISAKLSNILEMLEKDVNDSRILFNNFLSKISPNYPTQLQSIINPEYPGMVGDYIFAIQMKSRIEEPMEDFHLLKFDPFDCERGVDLKNCIKHSLDEINQFISEKLINGWTKHFLISIEKHLNDSLIIRHDRKLYENYSDEFRAAHMSIRFMINHNIYIHYDELLLKDFRSNEKEFNEIRILLKRIIEWYNYCLFNTHETEQLLISDELNEFDKHLNDLITNMNWKQYDIDKIRRIHQNLKTLYERICTAQKNLQNVIGNLNEWCSVPLYTRKKSKTDNLLDIVTRQILVHNRLSKCVATKMLIDHVIYDNWRLFKNVIITTIFAQPETDTVQFKTDDQLKETIHISSTVIIPDELKLTDDQRQHYLPYLKYFDELVGEQIIKALIKSLRYIRSEMQCDNVDEENSCEPLFKIKYILERPHTKFIPNLDSQSNHGFQALINSIVFDIYGMADMITRIAPPNEQNASNEKITYESIIQNNAELEIIRNDILRYVADGVRESVKRVQQFNIYEPIWAIERDKYLEKFLFYGHPLTMQEMIDIDNNAYDDEPKKLKLETIENEIVKFKCLLDEVKKIKPNERPCNWLCIDVSNFRTILMFETRQWILLFINYLKNHVRNSLKELDEFIIHADQIMLQEISEKDYEKLVQILDILKKIDLRRSETDEMFEPLKNEAQLLKKFNEELENNINNQFNELPQKWAKTKKNAMLVLQRIGPIQLYQIDLTKKRVSLLEIRMKNFRSEFRQMDVFNANCINAYEIIDDIMNAITDLEKQAKNLESAVELFNIDSPDCSDIEKCRQCAINIKEVWDNVYIILFSIETWKKTLWKKIDVESIDNDCKKFGRDLRLLDANARSWDPFILAEAHLKNLMTSLRALTELQNPALRERHWNELKKITQIEIKIDDKMILANLLDLNLHRFEDDVKNIVDKSVKEAVMEKSLADIENVWNAMKFEYDLHPRTQLNVLRMSEEMSEILDDHQLQLQNMMTSKFIAYFAHKVSKWLKLLSNVDQVIRAWFEVQRKWLYLEIIFIGSEDIRMQLPDDTDRFARIDEIFKEKLMEITSCKNIIEACSIDGLYDILEKLLYDLALCERALNDYLETKRLAFPRFYFISSADLLDILSNGSRPEIVCKHMTKLYDSIKKLIFNSESKVANAMMSKENDEIVEFIDNCNCDGRVEEWLNRVTIAMKKTLHSLFHKSLAAYEDKPREKWIFDWPAQPSLCVTQIIWSSETSAAFKRLESGHENALRDYQKKQISQLNALINLLLGNLTKGERQKIMTICTIDVHSRDVIGKLILQKVRSANAFQWQSQLRHRWDNQVEDCFVNICDAQFKYDYEYLGNTPRLVITPLTDRCYITLTQSLHLVMGGAPAGPAGTGKTETTKDLGKGLGMMVYVFNCSEQMDYRSCGNIYKGLSQSGAWGCFDEFNRISVEVLSVVAVQVKTILDAIKSHSETFNFMGENIKLSSTVGLFITMNPGYAGRTELPENLKSLFRPCAMVVPDFALISEIMLVAEGFQEARILSRKFITLYTLCRELLSKQDHYDWGLRAIKSVLVVAGALKRNDRDRPEDQVLMRALRDFNVPKIVTDDMSVFLGLIGDLFPALDVPRLRDVEFENHIKSATVDSNLQSDEKFVLKIVQLEELLAVRHSVFIVGDAGTGKSEVWKTLYRTYQKKSLKPIYNVLDPKAVTNDELFGVINPITREWKDGLFSVIMRDLANMSAKGPKWIVLDGDIDPMWIESLNTLMDDNKILTLASNERIALTPEMRCLFEIGSLKTATPATVSRAGILYINKNDIGWQPFVDSWIKTRESNIEKSLLPVYFDKYFPNTLHFIKTKLKQIIPMSEIGMVQTVCHLLDCFLTEANIPSDCPKEWYEIYFVFSTIWGFGSTLFQDQIIDWRNEFSKWWIAQYKTVRFPDAESNIFNYYIDPVTKELKLWTELLQPFILNSDIPIQSVLVNTSETMCLSYFIDLLIAAKHPVMLVGTSGTGKSNLIADRLNALSSNYLITNVPLNYYTTSAMLQNVLEKPLEKKTGRSYGPSGSHSMIYFVDDLNMPKVDEYGTVQPHTLIRQFMDYRHWYDRQKLTLKDIQKCQFVSCMNPVAGSFTIDSRLQRHFKTFAVNNPHTTAIYHIFHSILSQHVKDPSNHFTPKVIEMSQSIVNATIALHTRINQLFLPTATKFHYNFNLRDLANLFSGMLNANGDCCPNDIAFVRLWLHESNRVYGDKMTCVTDLQLFAKEIKSCCSKTFERIDIEKAMEKPNIFFHFAEGLGDPKYMPISDLEKLNKILEEAQNGYDEIIGSMSLVLFEDAMSHICRISRILQSDHGNVMLVGVGGSGKQTLTRLAAFISALHVFQTQIRKGFGIGDLKADLATLYLKTGIKNNSCCYLMTDSQIANEQFLVVINDLLATGNITDLFASDEMDNIIETIRNEAKQTGILDTKENCWNFYINKVRSLLKIVLCFSPVGPTLRIRARKFPAIINCTSINWFHEWPTEALESVSKRFLADIEVLHEDLINSVSSFMAYVHNSVNSMSDIYLQNEKRYNYTTPKTFLELIALYSKIFNEKHIGATKRIQTLEAGLLKLASCAEQVDGLKEVLREQEVVLNVKKTEADKQLAIVTLENNKVQDDKDAAAEKEKRVRIIEEDVSAKTKICAADLKKAEPAVLRAIAALDTLDKNNLTEMKSFGSPPQAVIDVSAAVLILFTKGKKVPRPNERSWKHCKVIMAKVDKFLFDLKNYDKKNIREDVIEALLPYVNSPDFNPDKIRVQSKAAAGLCEWVINIYKFYEIYLDVGPKERALEKSEKELQEAQDTLTELNTKLDVLQQQLDVLQLALDAATDEKAKCQAEADKTAYTIDLAFRLVDGLASEKIRWQELIQMLNKQINTLPGDMLLVSCFLSYVGCFTSKYRSDLRLNYWLPKLETIDPRIPIGEIINPMDLICDAADIAAWNNEGLPNDKMSIENAAILINSSRWPLMIDPQLQGIKWIKQKYGDNLIVTRLTTKNYLDRIERAILNGDTLLIENIDETVDAVLEPLLGRVFIKKGTVVCIGEKEIDYNPSFRLIVHTKLANPHFKPEIQAQMTLINFSVTKDGLLQQLLAEVVRVERPDLEEMKSNLTQEQNQFKIMLKTLEEDLLQRLSSAGENVLEDESLVLNLEATKKTSTEIETKVQLAKVTTVQIDNAREQYQVIANRATILYFILNDLHKLNPIYQFSLKAFTGVFHKAIASAENSEILNERIITLLDSITYEIFVYTARALFEKDKLTFVAQIGMQILKNDGIIGDEEINFLLRYPYEPNVKSPVDFLSDIQWGGITSLSKINDFVNIDRDVIESYKRWEKLVDCALPEVEKLPGDWKNKNVIKRLCILRSLRPDRMCHAVKIFVDELLGRKYVEPRIMTFSETFNETSNIKHTFFILSPGVDPLKDVEQIGVKMNVSSAIGNLHNVSLGQGQEVIAEAAIDLAAKKGHWVILQNIHLVQKWLPALEKKIETTINNSDSKYRLFVSAEPASSAEYHIIPQGILESAIKITNEPPTGMMANLHKALNNFTDETFDMCSKVTEFKSIIFSLCYFHAVVCERRRFGAQGWNRVYPFNFGDLTISVNVLQNYLEANNNVPWEDLRYLFGEIMYGGHITDDWDRRLCRTYLEVFMQQNLIDGETFLAKDFPAPSVLDYNGYHQYIDMNLPSESPELYGLHSNAEIGVMTNNSEMMFKVLFELQPKETASSSNSKISKEEIILRQIDDFLEKIPEAFNVKEMMSRTDDLTPYIIVAFQECDRMNMLMQEIKRSLEELVAGLKGILTITTKMENLQESIYVDKVPDAWTILSYPSQLGLQSWFADLLVRLRELEAWITDLSLPSSVWLAGLFNPQSFLTAIMQQTARKNQWPLDKMCLNCEVTKKSKQDFNSAPREGAYINGLFMEGARWDSRLNSIVDSIPMELFPMMPVIYVVAVTQDKQDVRNVYECPLYKIRMRGPTYVWNFNLKTKEHPSKWSLAGVCLLLQK